MEKYFDINRNGFSIRCKLYANDPNRLESLVLFGHGFGGHKENKAAARFARYVLSKHKGAGVLVFDWPCHGTDGRKKLSLEDCGLYLDVLADYIGAQLRIPCDVYATSFGGYLILKYLSEKETPFGRIALRCPAIPLYQTFTQNIMTEENRKDLAKGKTALVGFDRKIKIGPAFLREVEEADLTRRDFRPFADRILILHGTKDEIVSFSAVENFALKNQIPFVPIENADHRFVDPQKMDKAICCIADFLFQPD